MTQTPDSSPQPPQPPAAVQPPAPVPQAPAQQAPAGPDGLTPDEERELARLQDKAAVAAAGRDVIHLKVEAPHESLAFGHRTIGNDWTPVPARAVGDILSAAAAAGVEISQRAEQES